jgi:lipoprotein NlpI
MNRVRDFAILSLLVGLPAAADVRAEDNAADLVSRGMQKFRDNDIAGSLADFDRAVQLDPKLSPHLWQRGIADYYAGKFGEGRRQFELHQTVNPHDVENAAWHFLCVARQAGLSAARKSMLRIDTARDTRVPMAEIYQLFAGRGSPEAVLRAAARDGNPQSMMYANLYVGLYFEAAGNKEQAKMHLQEAARAHVSDNYMHDVAKVHLEQRHWDR